MGSPTRLRQVALVAAELGPVGDRLQSELGLDEPFHDPGVGTFGLENSVFAVGGSFIEVVAPIAPDTTAGRYLAKHGGDGGYMAIFQLPDLAAARRRVADLGIRVVWSSDYPDIAGTHLHPKDVPGAIVSLDWAQPADSWRWAGPAWTGRTPAHRPGGILGLTVESPEPAALARRWGSVLDIEPEGLSLSLDEGRQAIGFATGAERITEVTVALPTSTSRVVEIGGVQFVIVPGDDE